jgi:phosphopantetheine--protein transferase-like protein
MTAGAFKGAFVDFFPALAGRFQVAIRVGCDIVSLSAFQRRVVESGDLLPERLFHPCELSGANLERLAGLFAAKEAAFKALGLPAGAWLRLCVEHDEAGAPLLRLLDADGRVKDLSVSIAHSGDNALAVVVASLE